MIQNKYEIRSKIGNGTFGSVFLGENRISKKPVAIKIEEKEGCIRNESRILEYLVRNRCKNIANIFWYGVQEKYTILVMTYIDGIPLSKYMESASSLDVLQNTWISAINILEKIHSVGVIHRDIKPDHFLFWKQEWYLIDFGFATFSLPSPGSGSTFDSVNLPFDSVNLPFDSVNLPFDSLNLPFDSVNLPKREYIMGTPNYISISIHNGFSPTARDDLISLGYIFLEMVLSLAIGERLPWTQSLILETTTEYPECHILHVQNQYKKTKKEKWEMENPEHLVGQYLQEIYTSSTEYQKKNIYTKLINRIKQYK